MCQDIGNDGRRNFDASDDADAIQLIEATLTNGAIGLLLKPESGATAVVVRLSIRNHGNLETFGTTAFWRIFDEPHIGGHCMLSATSGRAHSASRHTLVERGTTIPTPAGFDAFCQHLESRDDAAALDLIQAQPAIAKCTIDNGETALHRAAKLGCGRVIVDALVKAGACLDAAARMELGTLPDFFSCTWNYRSPMPLMAAAAGGICYLTPLMVAAANGQTDVVKALLHHGAYADTTINNGRTALICAAANGHCEVIDILLRARANRNATMCIPDWRSDGSTEYLTPLMAAAANGHTDAVEALLRAGAEPNGAIHYRSTALICAATNGHWDVIDVLVGAGADIEATDRDGRTALVSAARLGNHEALDVLLHAGVNREAKCNHGFTALIYAAQYGH